MDINDDIYSCPAHELEICVSLLKERHSHTCLCLLVCVCVCDSRVCFPQMFPLTFDPTAGVKPWQMRWSSSGQNCKHSTTILCPPPPPLSPHIRHSSPLCSSQRVSSTTSAEKVLVANKHGFIAFAVGILKHAHFKLRITTWVETRICLVHRRRENGGEAVLKIWILQPCTLKAHCVFGKLVSDVKDEKCCSVVFYTRCWL